MLGDGHPGVGLSQDGTRYFDLHHTPDDTLDKIDPAQLRQNVAAWTTVLAILSGGIEEPKRTQAALSSRNNIVTGGKSCEIFIALPLLALAACQVTKDDANDSITVEYNQDVAENGARGCRPTWPGTSPRPSPTMSSRPPTRSRTRTVDVDVDIERPN